MNSVVGIGIDIERTSRFREKWKAKDRTFLHRLFSAGELKYCKKFRDPAPHLAARFCAKEAGVKAAQAVAPLLVTDVEVRSLRNGAPTLFQRNKRVAAARVFREYEFYVSLSHMDEMAVAFVVLVRKRRRS